MNKTVAIVIAVAVLVCVGMGGAAWWWMQQAAGPKVEQAPQLNTDQVSYVSLEKVVVMLQPEEGTRVQNYYLSLDLVLRTDKAHEKAVKAEFPMLKGVVVRSLSTLDLAQARAMSIDEWTDVLSRDLLGAYEGRMAQRGFDQVMVSRLIVE